MSNRGFNIKVREVANGFTIHFTHISASQGGVSAIETHTNYVAIDEHQVQALVRGIVEGECPLVGDPK